VVSSSRYSIPARFVFNRDKRFGDQTCNSLGDLLPLKGVPCEDKLCSLERKSSDEHESPLENHAFGLFEQIGSSSRAWRLASDAGHGRASSRPQRLHGLSRSEAIPLIP